MTVIFQGKEFWIESHRIDHGAVAATTTDGINFTLDKPGTFLGMTYDLNYTAITDLTFGKGSNTAGSMPAIGSFQTSLRSTVRNSSGNALSECIAIILVFMRKARNQV